MLLRHDTYVYIRYLQELRKQQTTVRLHDMKRDYISFLYGFRALTGDEAPDDLSTNHAAVFENANLAHIFFRCVACVLALTMQRHELPDLTAETSCICIWA
jgi:hypothetical protein